MTNVQCDSWRGLGTVPGFWPVAHPSAEAHSLTATGTPAAEDRPLLATQRDDPHPPDAVLHPGGALARLYLVRRCRQRASQER